MELITIYIAVTAALITERLLANFIDDRRKWLKTWWKKKFNK